MKKLKGLLIIIGVLVIGYFGFKMFLGPEGYTSESDLINGFVDSLSSTDVCETHYNTETQSNCQTAVNLLKDETVSVVSINISGDKADVVLSVNGNNDTFTFYFIQEDVTGFKSYFYTSYYIIDYLS